MSNITNLSLCVAAFLASFWVMLCLGWILFNFFDKDYSIPGSSGFIKKIGEIGKNKSNLVNNKVNYLINQNSKANNEMLVKDDFRNKLDIV
uniref:Uncharacterized protein n=1 Tax=Rhabditophanes sp. KR3021 TaxID=114890 RepID=A0AC35UEK6_9BILA